MDNLQFIMPRLSGLVIESSVQKSSFYPPSDLSHELLLVETEAKCGSGEARTSRIILDR